MIPEGQESLRLLFRELDRLGDGVAAICAPTGGETNPPLRLAAYHGDVNVFRSLYDGDHGIIGEDRQVGRSLCLR